MNKIKNFTRRTFLILGVLFFVAATPALADKTTYQSDGVAILMAKTPLHISSIVRQSKVTQPQFIP